MRQPKIDNRPNTLDWKAILAKAYTKVPKSIGEAVWRLAVAGMVTAAGLTGYMVWRNPGIIFGEPRQERSIMQILAGDKKLKDKLYSMLSDYYVRMRPHGMMFVAWEQLNELHGLWVKPAQHFPGKSGVHQLTEDMRVLSGPFMFNECAYTESMAIPGKVMIACPVVSTYDVWGYIAIVVDNDNTQIEHGMRTLSFLAHRFAVLIY